MLISDWSSDVFFPIFVLLTLPRGPGEARWLTTEQKAWLASALATSAEGVADEGNVWRTFTDPRVLLLCLVYIGFPLAAYGLSYWLPTIVAGFGVSNTANGRSEEHTSELQSLMRISYAVFCLKKKINNI